MNQIKLLLVAFIIIILSSSLYNYFKTKRENKIELINTSMDTGKTLFINTILKYKNKNAKYVDSIYDIRKDSILSKL